MMIQKHSSTKVVSRWLLAASMLAAVTLATGARAGEDEAVGEANAQFYAALNAMFTGEVAPMEAVWSHRDDVTYMGPDGRVEVGWALVRETWQRQAAKKLGGRVEPKGMHANLGTDLAVITLVETGENTNANGETAKVSIRATNVFRKENGAWKMIGHHTDLLPFLEEPAQVGSLK